MALTFKKEVCRFEQALLQHAHCSSSQVFSSQVIIKQSSAIYGRIITLQTGRLAMFSASKMKWAESEVTSELYMTTSVCTTQWAPGLRRRRSYVPGLLCAERDLWGCLRCRVQHNFHQISSGPPETPIRRPSIRSPCHCSRHRQTAPRHRQTPRICTVSNSHAVERCGETILGRPTLRGAFCFTIPDQPCPRPSATFSSALLLSKLLPPSWLAYGLFCAQIYPSAHLRADALGFGSDGGPGRGFPSPDPPQEKRYGGGGGGFGGNGADACGKSAPFGGVGSLYGSISRPFHFGSGGGIGSWTGKTSDSRSPGGRAGGRIWIEWVGIVWINGRISADGGSSSCIYEDDRSGGGGSGGSCYVLAYSLQGAGAVSAVGGDSGRGCASLDTGGGGSGGRIAVYVKSDVSVSKIGTEWQGILSRKISMQIHGGRSGIYRNCTNGASGTAYRAAVWVVPGLGNPVVVNESKLILDSNMSSGSATDGGGSADNDSVAPAAITPIVPEARVDLLQCTACGALTRNES